MAGECFPFPDDFFEKKDRFMLISIFFHAFTTMKTRAPHTSTTKVTPRPFLKAG